MQRAGSGEWPFVASMQRTARNTQGNDGLTVPQMDSPADIPCRRVGGVIMKRYTCDLGHSHARATLDFAAIEIAASQETSNQLEAQWPLDWAQALDRRKRTGKRKPPQPRREPTKADPGVIDCVERSTQQEDVVNAAELQQVCVESCAKGDLPVPDVEHGGVQICFNLRCAQPLKPTNGPGQKCFGLPRRWPRAVAARRVRALRPTLIGRHENRDIADAAAIARFKAEVVALT